MVVYYPAGATASLLLHVRGESGHGTRWFNPRTGQWTDHSNRGLWTPPDDEDWVLVVKP